jgi:hypothetical protein
MAKAKTRTKTRTKNRTKTWTKTMDKVRRVYETGAEGWSVGQISTKYVCR